MNRERNNFVLWTTLAGALLLAVGTYDLWLANGNEKSGFVVILELIAGLGFLLNAALHWSKHRSSLD